MNLDKLKEAIRLLNEAVGELQPAAEAGLWFRFSSGGSAEMMNTIARELEIKPKPYGFPSTDSGRHGTLYCVDDVSRPVALSIKVFEPLEAKR